MAAECFLLVWLSEQSTSFSPGCAEQAGKQGKSAEQFSAAHDIKKVDEMAKGLVAVAGKTALADNADDNLTELFVKQDAKKKPRLMH